VIDSQIRCRRTVVTPGSLREDIVPALTVGSKCLSRTSCHDHRISSSRSESNRIPKLTRLVHRRQCFGSVAAEQGFEPQSSASKAGVLPLDDSAVVEHLGITQTLHSFVAQWPGFCFSTSHLSQGALWLFVPGRSYYVAAALYLARLHPVSLGHSHC
jgi:hypothetical protein